MSALRRIGGGKQTPEVAGRAKTSRQTSPKQTLSILLDTHGGRGHIFWQKEKVKSEIPVKTFPGGNYPLCTSNMKYDKTHRHGAYGRL